MSRIFQVLVVVGLAGIFVLAQNNTGTHAGSPFGVDGPEISRKHIGRSRAIRTVDNREWLDQAVSMTD